MTAISVRLFFSRLPAIFGAVAFLAAVGCGDDDSGDTPDQDAAEADAAVDAGDPDAATDAAEADASVDAGDPDAATTTPSTLGGVAGDDNSLASHPQTGPVTTGDIWVDPNAGTNGSGTEGSPYDNLGDALSAVNDGERIIVRAGTISLSGTIIRNTSWATGIEVFNYGTDRPVIDASGLGSSSQALYFTGGANEHWKGFEFINGPDRGINIEASNTTIEDCWVHGFQGDGIYIADFGGGASDNVIQDCAVWNLGDGVSTDTNVPDCYVATGNTGSPTQNNTFARCFAANCPDDGFDAFRGRGTRFYDCVAYDSGTYANGNPAGDGNGFKMGGGDNDSGDNYAIGCLSINNAFSGFTHNEAANTSGTDPNIVYAFCTADGNGSGGINTGGDQADHLNVRRDCIITNNGSVGYVGANAVALRDITSGVTYFDSAGGDYSLDTGSNGIGDGIEGGIENSVDTQPTTGTATNAGASVTALEIALEWLAKDLT